MRLQWVVLCLAVLTLSACSTFQKEQTHPEKSATLKEQKKAQNPIATEQNQAEPLEENSIYKVTPFNEEEIEKQHIDDTQEANQEANHQDENQPATNTSIEEVVSYQNLWDKIPSLYQIPSVNNKRIASQKRAYLRNPKYLHRVSERAKPYLYLIVNQLEQRNMPGELALLPIVESAFQTYAYSHGRASGIWQFIPGTAKQYGLRQSWWYDGRRDVYAATNAALDYLESLSRTYNGDWLLALAAYNSGAGTVNRAIRKNRKQAKPTQFWDLKLPRETKAYVPKLIALAQIIQEVDKNSIKLVEIPNQPYLEIVDCDGHIDLAVAADLAQISIDDLYRYNPGFNQWATDPQGPHHILLPVDKVATFKANLAGLSDDKRLRWMRHEIRRGETLSSIAKKYHITVATLKQANQLKNSRIRAGKFLTIPVASKNQGHYSQTTAARQNKVLQKIHEKRKTVYRVRKGDSLWTISRKFHMNYRQLAKMNNMSPLDTLSIGQKLLVRTDMKHTAFMKAPPSREAKTKKLTYKVRKGDSLYHISRKFRVKINDLLKWNRISKTHYLQPGQKLTLFVDV